MAYLPYVLPSVTLAGLLAGLAVVLRVAERLLVNYGMCQIDVDDGEQTFEVEGGQSLLSALLDAKIKIPNACAGKGSCGYCKVTVLEGGGKVLPTETPYLSRQEIRGNVRLACQVKVRSDVKVKLVDFLVTVRNMVKNRTYNPDLKWSWYIDSPPRGGSPARDAALAKEAEKEEAPAPASEEDRAFVEKAVKEHASQKGALIASLQAVNEHYRYLPAWALSQVASGLEVPFSRVYSLATFYNTFSLTPKGKCTIKVCLGTACHVKGAMRVIERLERELGVKEGETTKDGMFTLEGVRCLGCCGLAPVLTFDDEVHGKAMPAQMPDLLEASAPVEELAAPLSEAAPHTAASTA